MIEISKNANPNYLCKIVRLDNLRKHENADRLQIATVDFQTVITGLEAKGGDLYIYFPPESKINAEFLAHTNSFRKSLNLNNDFNAEGFFEKNCRVKTMKLRGEKSVGYIVPIEVVEDWYESVLKKTVTFSLCKDFRDIINQEFDSVRDIKLVEKYQIKEPSVKKDKQGKVPKLSRLVKGQIHLHVDTKDLRRNIDKLNPEDIISITYKTHGTSWWVSNVLTKKSLNWFEKILLKFKIDLQEEMYDIIYGSRRVVKNKHFDPKGQDHYFGYDLWSDIKDQVKDKIPKGYTLYGECLGYTKEGEFIQKDYDYGCESGIFKLEVYRITHTTPDGLVTELTYPQIKEFCERVELDVSHLFFYGAARDWCVSNIKAWREVFIDKAERLYNEKYCFMCKNKVPEEGIVLRKESLFSFEAYKLKSFNFLERETKELDRGESNLEEEN